MRAQEGEALCVAGSDAADVVGGVGREPDPAASGAPLVTTGRHDSRIRPHMDSGTRSPRTPGDLLLHPAVASSLGTLILNDHVLKDQWPGWVTGKASDLVGLYAFPMVVVAGTEVALWLGRRRAPHAGWAVPARWTGAVIATVAAGFVAIKLAPPAGDLYQAGLGALRWLPGAGFRALSGGELGAPGRAALVRDPTDLVALVALRPAWRTARRRTTPDAASRRDIA
jgi:hypothetical protein